MRADRFRHPAVGAGLCLLLAAAGCGRRADHATAPAGRPAPPAGASGVSPIDLPAAAARPGIAVVILVDTSGSMGQRVRDRAGRQRPKHEIAREALERIIDQTARWKAKHPDRTLQLGIAHFSSSVRELLPAGDFDADKARAALGRLPPPNSGTAIGRALEDGFKALYRTGCARKYVICVTDGENTSGPPPDRVARQLHAQTGGEVETHFVAFDTSARYFAFLKGVNGFVVEAADGEQLQTELTNIYDKRILAEKPEPETPQ
jgi:Mg-chelatase subunit ChlD